MVLPKKKFLQAPCGRTCSQQQQSRSTTATFTSTATFENTISRATTATTFPIPYDLSLLLWRLSLLRLPLGQRGEKRLAGRILKKTIINVLFWGKKYCSNISYQFSPGRGAGVCLCVISVSCLWIRLFLIWRPLFLFAFLITANLLSSSDIAFAVNMIFLLLLLFFLIVLLRWNEAQRRRIDAISVI